MSFSNKAFRVVELFEEAVADFAGSRYAIAVNTCTSALFLCLKYVNQHHVVIPARTFISVPMAALHAGYSVQFMDYEWDGVYELQPHGIIDGALRFRKGMYEGGLHCLSFQARKHLNIGEGGMILTDETRAMEWLKKARYWGRDPKSNFRIEDVSMIGWQAYMTPEKAARGLHLMEYIEPYPEDQKNNYPDLRSVPAFHPAYEVVGHHVH